jgi:hypothetical protein
LWADAQATDMAFTVELAVVFGLNVSLKYSTVRGSSRVSMKFSVLPGSP